jgi:hypothetical protein
MCTKWLKEKSITALKVVCVCIIVCVTLLSHCFNNIVKEINRSTEGSRVFACVCLSVCVFGRRGGEGGGGGANKMKFKSIKARKLPFYVCMCVFVVVCCMCDHVLQKYRSQCWQVSGIYRTKHIYKDTHVHKNVDTHIHSETNSNTILE